MKKDKQIIVGINEDARKKHLEKRDLKMKVLIEAFTYAKEFIPTLNRDLFQKNFKKSFSESFEKYYKGQFPKMVSVEKQIELAGASLYQLESYQKQFDAIAVDLNTYEDFNIYLNNAEAIQKYELIQSTIEAIERLKTIGIHLYYAQIQSATQGAIMFDFSKNELRPSIQFCLTRSRN